MKNGWSSGPGSGLGASIHRLPRFGYPAGIYVGVRILGDSILTFLGSAVLDVSLSERE